MYNNSNWVASYSNLRKAQRIWGMFSNVLGKTGAPIKSWVMVYKAVLHVLLLYGIEIWVVTE